MSPIISIIIPCYNVAEYLPTCMQSLEAQTIGFDRLELIFIDDCSTDNGATWKKLLAFEAMHPENVIAIQHETNLCQGGARNTGLQYASAKYIGFIDADDWIHPTMYEKLYHSIQKYQCDVTSCKMFIAHDPLHVVVRDPCADEPEHYVNNGTCMLDGGSYFSPLVDGVVTKLYRKDLITDNQVFFPERLRYEDNYWAAILGLYIKDVCYVEENLYYYRINMNSTLHSSNARHHLDRMPIELMKLEKYKELGVYQRFKDHFDADFLNLYYGTTLYLLCSRFDHPDYQVFCELTRTTKQLIPDFAKNPYLDQPVYERTKALLPLIDMNLTEEEFCIISEAIAKS